MEIVVVLAIAFAVLIPGSPLSASSAPAATATPLPLATSRATPAPAATPSASPTAAPVPTPIPTASAAPSPRPTQAVADYRLPTAVQAVSLRLTSGERRCDGEPAAFDAPATFIDIGGGALRIVFQGRTVAGMLHGSGAFDAAGADPLEHWSGRLTAAGGRARYEVYASRGCVQSYDVIIAFK